MKINPNAKKLVTLSKTAIKSLKEGQIRAWFLVEGKPKHYFFYIDMKNKSPSKFKEPRTLKKLLERFKIDEASDVSAKASLLAGTVSPFQENMEFHVSIKRNGAGSSVFKSVLKNSAFKKIVPNAKIVKTLSGAVEKEEEEEETLVEDISGKTPEEIEQDLIARDKKKEEEVQRVIQEREEAAVLEQEAQALKLNDEEKKALKMHHWSQKEHSQWASTPAKEEHEDFFHTALKRLVKFQKQKLYRCFDKRHFIKRAFGKKNPLLQYAKTFLLTKAQLPMYIKTCEKKIEQIEMEKSWTDEEAEIAALFDDATIGKFDAFEQYLLDLKFNDDQTAGIISAFGVDNKSEFEELYKACQSQRKQVLLLCKKLGNDDWAFLRNILATMEM